MSNFYLNPADIIVNVNDRHDPLSSIKRWAVGPFDHVLMYLGKVGIIVDREQRWISFRFPMLFESNGRGVVIQALSNRYGQEVVVMRLKPEYRAKIPRVLKEAVKLASDERSYYDYYAIARWVLPRIIREKLHLPIPIAWHRDERQICSEAVFEIFDRAKLVDILPSYYRPPMPDDFVTDSLLLEGAWAGRLLEEVV